MTDYQVNPNLIYRDALRIADTCSLRRILEISQVMGEVYIRTGRGRDGLALMLLTALDLMAAGVSNREYRDAVERCRRSWQLLTQDPDSNDSQESAGGKDNDN